MKLCCPPGHQRWGHRACPAGASSGTAQILVNPCGFMPALHSPAWPLNILYISTFFTLKDFSDLPYPHLPPLKKVLKGVPGLGQELCALCPLRQCCSALYICFSSLLMWQITNEFAIHQKVMRAVSVLISVKYFGDNTAKNMVLNKH